MLTPRFLATAPDPIVRLYADLETEILLDIIHRIGSVLDTSAINPTRVFYTELSAFNKVTAQKIAQFAQIAEPELIALVNQSIIASLRSDETIYKKMAASGKLPRYIALKDSAILRERAGVGIDILTRRMQAQIAQTAATAGVILGRGISQAIAAKDLAYFNPQRFIRSTIRALGQRGIYAVDSGGREISMEAFVRQDIITGINKMAADVGIMRAAEVGNDLVQTSAHFGARPTHAEWQGKIFSLSGSDPTFPPFTESTGFGTVTGLCGVNCRHSFYPYFRGYSLAPTDIDSQRNKEQYDMEQQQRYNERKIRQWKRINQMENQQELDSTYSAAKVADWQQKNRELIASEDWLQRDYNREQIG